MRLIGKKSAVHLLRQREETQAPQIHGQVIGQLKESNYRVEVASDFDYETTSQGGLVFATSPRVKTLFTNFNTLGGVALATSDPADVLRALAKVRRTAT